MLVHVAAAVGDGAHDAVPAVPLAARVAVQNGAPAQAEDRRDPLLDRVHGRRVLDAVRADAVGHAERDPLALADAVHEPPLRDRPQRPRFE
ncbi:hypothetical protein [Frigoriglobus tundricola]|uniref:hypothetical protein n=1 Tax=Frigoriglobus tundricola TaxID=2774151 RepID=UPI00148EB242|nr:hypothetical protein [Frigoriglobus tundricola]